MFDLRAYHDCQTKLLSILRMSGHPVDNCNLKEGQALLEDQLRQFFIMCDSILHKFSSVFVCFAITLIIAIRSIFLHS